MSWIENSNCFQIWRHFWRISNDLSISGGFLMGFLVIFWEAVFFCFFVVFVRCWCIGSEGLARSSTFLGADWFGVVIIYISTMTLATLAHIFPTICSLWNCCFKFSASAQTPPPSHSYRETHTRERCKFEVQLCAIMPMLNSGFWTVDVA